jgi:uncharacterized protein
MRSKHLLETSTTVALLLVAGIVIAGFFAWERRKQDMNRVLATELWKCSGMDPDARCDLAAVRALIRASASVHTHGEGMTVVEAAARYGDEALVKELIERGASVSGDYNTPVLAAAAHGHARVVELLVASGADPNAGPGGGFPPLMHAAARGHVVILRQLLAAGVDVNAKAYDDSTALMHAIDFDQIEAVKFLLAHGADVNLRDNIGRTARAKADARSCREIQRLVKQAGGKY